MDAFMWTVAIIFAMYAGGFAGMALDDWRHRDDT